MQCAHQKKIPTNFQRFTAVDFFSFFFFKRSPSFLFFSFFWQLCMCSSIIFTNFANTQIFLPFFLSYHCSSNQCVRTTKDKCTIVYEYALDVLREKKKQFPFVIGHFDSLFGSDRLLWIFIIKVCLADEKWFKSCSFFNKQCPVQIQTSKNIQPMPIRTKSIKTAMSNYT